MCYIAVEHTFSPLPLPACTRNSPKHKHQNLSIFKVHACVKYTQTGQQNPKLNVTKSGINAE